jgi:hypothetical protein
MRFLGVLLVFAACHSESVASPDAASVPDAAPHSLGMFVAWSATPALPGALTDQLTVAQASFELARFQIVGDAGPGDARTSHAKFALIWDAYGTPPRESFPDAPVGVYSKLTLDMMPGTLAPYTYDIQGSWLQHNSRGGGDTLWPFRIRDFQSLSLSYDCDQTVPADGSATIAVNVALRDAIDNVQFDKLPNVGGILVLTTGDLQMPGFRDRLARAFTIDD